MKAAKIRLFLIIGVIVFTGGLWFFLRQTPLPEIKTVYKTTPVSKPSEVQLPQTQIQGKPHSHDEGTPTPIRMRDRVTLWSDLSEKITLRTHIRCKNAG